jgi:hypothetical protein
MTDEEKIRELAERFREAIIRCNRAELPVSLTDFPIGSCADASMLLGTYFKDNGIEGFNLVKGKRGEGSSLETHYWLEKSNVLVDISADQFEDVNEPVVIDEPDSKWYGAFDKATLQEADYHTIEATDVKAHLGAVYEFILKADKFSR